MAGYIYKLVIKVQFFYPLLITEFLVNNFFLLFQIIKKLNFMKLIIDSFLLFNFFYVILLFNTWTQKITVKLICLKNLLNFITLVFSNQNLKQDNEVFSKIKQII